MLLLNPKLRASTKRAAQKVWSRFFKRHSKSRAPIGLLTSGSQGDPKIVIHSFESILNSAHSVVTSFGVGPGDSWALALPTFHTGGLGIVARSYVSGAPFYELPRWSARDFVKLVDRHKTTLTSLVPAQIYDLISMKAGCPKSLRLVFVGGEALSAELDQKIRHLGWPIVKTYGMTETASMVAVSTDLIEQPFFKVLPHCEARLSRSGLIELKTPSLALGVLKLDGQFEPLHRKGFWQSEDCGELKYENGEVYLKVLGRQTDFLKIFGEQVHVHALELELQAVVGLNVVLCAVPKDRVGFELIACAKRREKAGRLTTMLQAWNKNRPAFERLSALCWIDDIPRSELGKVQRASLSKLVVGAKHRWQPVVAAKDSSK